MEAHEAYPPLQTPEIGYTVSEWVRNDEREIVSEVKKSFYEIKLRHNVNDWVSKSLTGIVSELPSGLMSKLVTRVVSK